MNYKSKMTSRVLGIVLAVTMVFTGMFSPFMGNLGAYAAATDPKTIEIKGNPTDTAVGEKLTAIAKDANGNVVENAVFIWRYDEYEEDDWGDGEYLPTGYISETGNTYTVPSMLGGATATGNKISVWAGPSASNKTAGPVELRITNRTPVDYDAQGNEKSDADILNEVKGKYDLGVLQPTFGTDTNIKTFLEADIAKKGFEGVTVTVDSSSNEDTIAADGTINYFYKDIDTEANAMNKYSQVTVNFTLHKGSDEIALEKKVNVFWDVDKLKADLKKYLLDAVTEDTIKGTNASLSQVKENMFLPAKVSGKTYAELKWESSNTNVISLAEKGYSWDDDYGYTATVKKPATDTDVVLTVYVNKYNFTNVSTEDTAVKTVKKTFTVTVKAEDVESKKAAMQADLDNFNLSKITYFNLGGVADLNAVKDDLQLPNLSKSGVTNKGKYKQLSYSSSDDTVVKVNGFRTFTYRPGYGEEAKHATITVKLTDSSNSNLYVTKEIPVTVVAVSDSELDEEYQMLLKVKAAYFDAIKNANESKDAITGDLHVFKEGRLDASGNAEFVYNVNKMNSCGIVPDDIPGYDPMGSALWRTFKSSRPDIIAHETLLVTQPKYDTEVTLESVLTSERFKAMAEADPTNEKLARLYKQPVSITLTVKGTDGPNPNAGGVKKVVNVIANFYKGTTKQSVVDFAVVEAASGLAKSYGITTPGLNTAADQNEVTMVDALVAMMAQSLGVTGPDDENASLVKGNITIGENGYVSNIFGEDASSMSGLLNGIMPHDNVWNDSYNAYNGLALDAAFIAAGDLLNFFFYQDTASYGDNFGFFEKDGARVQEITVPEDEVFSLTLKGYSMWYGMAKDETIAENTKPLEGIQLAINENFAFEPIEGAVTDEHGVATLSFDNKGTYVVSATGTTNTPLVPPYLKVTVVDGASEADRQQIVNADKEALTFDDFKAENTAATAITGNLAFPTVGASGKTKIAWASSVPATIAADGTVARPLAADGDKAVTLTATISYGTVTATKTFDLTVSKLEDSATVLEAVIAKLPSSLTPSEWNEDGDAKEDTNIITMVKELVRAENASVTVLDTCAPSAEQTQIAADGTITYGDSKVRNKNVTFTLKLGDVTKEYTAKVTVDKKQLTKAEVFKGDWLTFDAFKKANDAIDNVTTDLALPKEDNEDYYTEMEWTSSNEDVIKIDSYATNNKFAAKVTRPAAGQPDAVVTLTAKIKPGSYWAYGMGPIGPTPDPNYGIKTFTVTVKAVSAAEQATAQALVDEAIQIFNLDGVTVRGTDDKADMTALKYHYNDFPRNWNYADKLEGYKAEYKDKITIAWRSENPGIPDAADGKVNRTNADQTGDIVLTLTYDGATATKRFPTKVLAFSQAEADAENAALNEIAAQLSFDTINNGDNGPWDVKNAPKKILGATFNGVSVKFNASKTYHELGAVISWEVISGTGLTYNTAWQRLDLNRLDKNDRVVLRATLESPRFKDMPGVKKVTKDIVVYVTGTNDTALTAMPAEDIPAPAKDNLADAKKLAKGIYDYYAGKDDGWWGKTASFWHATGVNAYEMTNGLSSGISAEAKQGLVNNQIYNVENPAKAATTNASNHAKAIIALSAFGYNPADVLSVNRTKIDIGARLKAIPFEDLSKGSYASTAPYILLALNEGSFGADDLKTKNIEYIAANVANNYKWGPDTPAMMVQGIAPYYGKNAAATEAIDAFVAKMSETQKEDGTFGNANTNAMVIVALCELGINPDTDIRFVKNGNSALAGLLSQQAASGDPGFTYSNKWNEMATNQGFLALISAINTMETGKAYNVFDFSGKAKTQAVVTSNVKTEAEPKAPTKDTDITVYMTVKTPKGVWLPRTAVTVKEDALVYHAFTKALDAAGFSYVGAKKGYVSEITNANGETLAEFDMGRNSGWMYKVGKVLPTVGLNECTIKDGDEIVWYYVEDWTKDPDAVKNAGGKKAVDKYLQETGQATNIDDQTKPTAEDPTAQAAIAKTEEKTDAAGNKATIATDVNGKTATKVEVSTEAVKKAAEAGTAVALPVPQIKPQADVKKADSVKVELPNGTAKAAVTVPVTGADANTVLMKVAEDGTLTLVPTAVVTEDGAAMAATVDSGNYVVVENKVEFADVKAGDWFAEGAGFAGSRNLMVGVGGGKFDQAGKLTTAQTAAVIGRLKGEGTSESWNKAVAQFGTAQVNSRENTIGMLCAAYKELGGKVEVNAETGATAGYADADKISAENREAFLWAVQMGIIKGVGENRLDPAGDLTRGQFGTMLERFVKLLAKR